jgi:site-specific DNA-adenine methylase
MSDFVAPFPWFGGKRRVAPIVWRALGDVKNFVEPFFGSGAVLLGRPHEPHTETVNDLDGFVANAWRSIQAEPDAVAHYADQPVNECDLHARHLWLVQQRDLLAARLMGDHTYYDPIIAGYWLWGMACWIGGEFCSGKGPWHSVDGQLTKLESDCGQGVNRQRVHLGNSGKGVKRSGLGEAGLLAWMQALAERLRYVRVCCGDWPRVLGPSPTYKLGLTGVFLDPPYARSERAKDIYTVEADVSDAVREWALDNGDNPKLRIVLAGYDGEHDMPDTWRCVAWKAHGGYGNQGNGKGHANAKRERLWLSPHCLEVHP